MEFTKDDYVVEGNLEVTIGFPNVDIQFGKADKVIVKDNWIVAETKSGVSIINRENINSFDIYFKEV